MWPVAIGALALLGLGKLIVDVLEEDAWEAQQDYRARSQKLTEEVTAHNRELEHQLTSAAQSVEFERLRNLHYASHQKAQNSHRLLTDGKKCVSRLNGALRASVEQREELRNILKTGKGAQKQNARQALAEVQTLRKVFFKEREHLLQETEALKLQLKELNHNTHKLKLQVRDTCGNGGRIWYQRLENRKK